MNSHTTTTTTTAAEVSVAGLRIGVDGSVTRVTLAVADDGTCGGNLAELIGCRVFDVIRVRPGLDAWIDDEALLVDEPTPNIAASLLVSRFIGTPLAFPIIGTVVFTGADGPDTVGLPEHDLVRLERLARFAVLLARI